MNNKVEIRFIYVITMKIKNWNIGIYIFCIYDKCIFKTFQISSISALVNFYSFSTFYF